jgi:hypothetical protein
LFAVDPLSAAIGYLPGELLETRMPILKRRLELVQDSGASPAAAMRLTGMP